MSISYRSADVKWISNTLTVMIPALRVCSDEQKPNKSWTRAGVRTHSSPALVNNISQRVEVCLHHGLLHHTKMSWIIIFTLHLEPLRAPLRKKRTMNHMPKGFLVRYIHQNKTHSVNPELAKKSFEEPFSVFRSIQKVQTSSVAPTLQQCYETAPVKLLTNVGFANIYSSIGRYVTEQHSGDNL